VSTAGVVARAAARSSVRSLALMGAFMAFAVVAVADSYRSLYATRSDREALASLIEGNRAFESLFGAASGIDTVEGFTAWRAGTPVLLIVAVVSLLAATRLLRGEEDAGRWEAVLAGGIGAAPATAATLAALVAVLALPAAVAGAAFLSADADASQALAEALVLWGQAAVFTAVGAVAAQLVAPRSRAAGLAAIVMGATFALRIVADGVEGWEGLRAITPFGWAEMAQPLVEVRWGWVAIPFAVSIGLVAVAAASARRRDLGAGLLGYRDSRRSSSVLLGSAERYALRSSLRPAVVWTVATTAMATLLGLLAADIVDFLTASDAFARFASRIGPGFRLTGPDAFLGMAVTFVAIPVALAGVYRVSAARDEESSGRLDVTLAGTTRRSTLIAAWATAAMGVAAAVALVSVSVAFGVAALRGAEVRITDGWLAALNTLPAAAAFIGVTVLLFGLVPRWAAALSVGLVGVAELVALLGAQRALPTWLLDLSPFAYVRPVPSVPADIVGGITLFVLGVAATAVGGLAFGRRDVVRD
jgi:ABC-2 type transport system permease protein